MEVRRRNNRPSCCCLLLCLDKREDEFRGVVVGEWTFVDGFQRLSTPRSIGASIAVSHSGLKRPFRRDACIAGSLLSSCRFATFSCRGTPSGRFLEQWGAIVSVGIVSCLVQTHLVSSRKGRARTSPFLACARRFRERRHARLDVGLHPRVILPRPRDEPPHIDPAVLDGVLSAHSSRPSCRQTDQAKALQNKTLMRVLRRADVADAFRHRHVSAPRPILIGSRRTSGFAFLDGHRLASALTNRRRPLPFTFTKHNPGCGRNQNKKDKPIGSIWTGASCWELDGVPGRDLRCGLLCSMGCLPWRGVVFVPFSARACPSQDPTVQLTPGFKNFPTKSFLRFHSRVLDGSFSFKKFLILVFGLSRALVSPRGIDGFWPRPAVLCSPSETALQRSRKADQPHMIALHFLRGFGMKREKRRSAASFQENSAENEGSDQCGRLSMLVGW